MRTVLLMLLALAALPAVAAQTVWKWVDEKGITHYSDVAVPGATKLELSTGKSIGSVATPAPSASSSASNRPNPDPEEVTSYRDFEIWKPGNNENFVNTGGVVQVNIRLSPELSLGHSIYLYMDGQPLEGYSGDSLAYELKDVPRGTHSLVAVIANQRGRQIQQSPAVRFVVRQESAAQPPVGPALRPPPKPNRQAGQNKAPIPKVPNIVPTTQPSYAALNRALPAIDPATNRPIKPPVKTPKEPGPGK